MLLYSLKYLGSTKYLYVELLISIMENHEWYMLHSVVLSFNKIPRIVTVLVHLLLKYCQWDLRKSYGIPADTKNFLHLPWHTFATWQPVFFCLTLMMYFSFHPQPISKLIFSYTGVKAVFTH